jgi:riboflavin biosynthesis pyrimidine reductase
VTVVTAPDEKSPPATAGTARPPLELLWESESTSTGGVRGRGMPADLARRYGGQLLVPLHPDGPTVLANFVSTLDGIVAYGTGDLAGGGLISGSHEPDRFVMGLLRSLADVVVVGAGTVRGSSAHRWTPGHVHPASAPLFEAWRTSMGLAANPTTVVVTGSGDIPLAHAAINDAAIPVVIATTPRGAERLRGERLGDHVTVEVVGSVQGLTGADILSVGAVRAAGVVLTEGGPHLLGELVGADILDELFLTLAPQLAGRAADGRLGLVEGVAFAPADARWERLDSVRRSTDHLFLRYGRRDALDLR